MYQIKTPRVPLLPRFAARSLLPAVTVINCERLFRLLWLFSVRARPEISCPGAPLSRIESTYLYCILLKKMVGWVRKTNSRRERTIQPTQTMVSSVNHDEIRYVGILALSNLISIVACNEWGPFPTPCSVHIFPQNRTWNCFQLFGIKTVDT